MGLQDKALKANGLSRACGKCKLGMRRCTPEIAEVCKNAFVEGYKKGYEQNKRDQEQKISSILHDARENVSGKNLFIFFRDVRGDEDAAFIERMKFINPKEQCIGTVRWRPKQEGDPRQLPIAWVSEDDLLNLLGYNKQFKKLEAISLSVGWAAYPQKEYEENLEKYKDIRAQFSKHKKK